MLRSFADGFATDAVSTADLQLSGHPGWLWPELGQIECAHDISNATLWSFMQFEGRPSYNPALLRDFHGWGRNIRELKAEVGDALKYVVLGSRHTGVFCLGGDLEAFTSYITNRDRQALAAYGHSCVDILNANWHVSYHDIVTIGLVQGDALGGGFESLLSFDLICAERGTKFGFPEQLFGLFPGMGALSFLGRKIGFAKAEQLVHTGKPINAEELYEMGVVHMLAEPGKGVSTISKHIHRHGSRHAAEVLKHKAIKRANAIPFDELDDIVELWVDACLTLGAHDLAVMKRLVSAQQRLTPAAAPAVVAA